MFNQWGWIIMKKSLIWTLMAFVTFSSINLYASEPTKEIIPLADQGVSTHVINRNIPITKAEFITVILQAVNDKEQLPPIMDTHYALPAMERAEKLGIIELKDYPMETWSEMISNEEKSAILSKAAANKAIDMEKVYKALSEVLIEKVTVDGETVDLGHNLPSHYMGQVMLPLRNIAEAMGFEVEWDAATYTATLNNGRIESKVQIGFDSYLYKSVNAIGMSAPFSVGVAPKLIDGSVYVSSEYFSMFADCTISDWTMHFINKNRE